MTESTNRRNDEANLAEFVQLLTLHQTDIYLYIRSLVLDPDDADEALQNTNLVLWEKRAQFEPGTNFRAWVFQIARYKLLQLRAEPGRSHYCFSETLVEQLAAQASSYADEDSLVDKLRRCLAKLTAVDRQVIECRYSTLATCESIAQALGRPIRWVYKALGRIRQELSECIAHESKEEETA